MLRSGWCGVRILVVTRGFSLLKCPDWCRGPPSIQFTGCQGYFPFLKWLGYEVNHTPPSVAEVKNEWSYTSTLPICLLGVHWGKLYLLPQPNVWIMCFLCKIEELVLMQVMLTVVPPSLLCSGYQVFPGGKAARAWH
jgi:hypothetical protein